jgi:hypothetical protein
MTITTRDGLVAALASATDMPYYKASITGVSGFIYCTFRAAAGMPGASTLAVPTTAGRALSRNDSGSMPIPAISSVGYLTSVDLVGTVPGAVIWSDRLVEYGGLSSLVTTAQALSAVALPTRSGTGVGVELWIDIYTQLGSTASATVTASYTNSSGTAGRTATLVGGFLASVPANRCMRMALQAGDAGVQSVQSVTTATSSLTAGNFGVTLRNVIGYLPMIQSNVGVKYGYAETGLSQIGIDACVCMLVQCTTTSTGVIQGMLQVAQG